MPVPTNDNPSVVNAVPDLQSEVKSLLANDLKTRKRRRCVAVLCGILALWRVRELLFSIGDRTYHDCLLLYSPIESIVDLFTIAVMAIGLYAAARYSERALRVFAWLEILDLAACVTGFVFLIAMSFIDKNFKDQCSNDPGEIIKRVRCIIIYGLGVIFSIILIRLSFKLAKAFEEKKAIIISKAQDSINLQF